MIVIGEMADADTIETAFKGAETGHLVIASLPTSDALTTIERVLATLPNEEREIGRMRFSEAVRPSYLNSCCRRRERVASLQWKSSSLPPRFVRRSRIQRAPRRSGS